MNIQTLKGLPMRLWLLPLLFVALASSGSRDGRRQRDIAKWQHVLEEPQPAEDRLAERDSRYFMLPRFRRLRLPRVCRVVHVDDESLAE